MDTPKRLRTIVYQKGLKPAKTLVLDLSWMLLEVNLVDGDTHITNIGEIYYQKKTY
jgi:hypothetical protein